MLCGAALDAPVAGGKLPAIIAYPAPWTAVRAPPRAGLKCCPADAAPVEGPPGDCAPWDASPAPAALSGAPMTT